MEGHELTARSETGGGERRARRRRETVEEILTLAEQVMDERGPAAVTVSEVARRLGVRPPSIYKYFPSVRSIHDELFRRGQSEHLEVVRAAVREAPPGMAGVAAGLEAGGRWALARPGLAQLLFWRPVPDFEPTPEAFAPSVEMVALYRSALGDAVDAGELAPDGAREDAVAMLSVLVAGIMSQHLANEPRRSWDDGRFTRLLPQALELFRARYGRTPPPAPAPRSRPR